MSHVHRAAPAHRPRRTSAYECGVDPVGNARGRFTIKFYLVAVLFILFDIEAVFLYPWAVAFKQLGLYGLIEMLIFIAILFVGYVYLLRRRRSIGTERERADRASAAAPPARCSMVDDKRRNPYRMLEPAGPRRAGGAGCPAADL